MVTPPAATDASSKEWVPLEFISSATANKARDSNIDNKAKNGDSAVQKVDGGSSKSSIKGAPTRDAESGALVWCSPSGNSSVVVAYEDGLTVTRHADGTVQRWWRGEGDRHSVDSGLVLVECPGFASIEVSFLGDRFFARCFVCV